MSKTGAIKEYRIQHPNASLQDIGSYVGCSRENARQALSRCGLPTTTPNYGYSRDKLCICGKQISYSSTYCRQCWIKSKYTELTCEVCGKLILRRLSLHRWRIAYRTYKHIWCSRKCQGKWLANNYGFGVR